MSGTIRVAVVADIHGNSWALDAVLEDLETWAPDQVFNLGDCTYGPLDPEGTMERLRPWDWPTVRGNQDRALGDAGAEARSSSTFRHVLQSLSAEDLEWHVSLPLTLSVPLDPKDPRARALLCHGSPARDDVYLLERVGPHGAELATAESVAAALDAGPRPVDEPLIFCGHTHVPRVIGLPDGRLVVNPGSVGLPAYEDIRPHPHAMQTGSPHARYARLERSGPGSPWTVDLRAVSYDFEPAVRAARRLGRDDWATWLASGRAR